MNSKFLLLCGLSMVSLLAYQQKQSEKTKAKNTQPKKISICCESKIPYRFATLKTTSTIKSKADISHGGMGWNSCGTYEMGGDNKQAAKDEFPKHKVTVDGFWMDATEVTNGEFAQFVKATTYVTTAE